MKTATVRDLRNEFGRISKWLEAGETVQVFKRGKLFADLVPSAANRPRTLLDATPSSHALPQDLDESVEADWEALR